MADRLVVDLAGEAVGLHAGRALHWPARARLVIADLHLGKADAFRRAGIGLPSGGTAHDLARLDALLAATRAQELWILGDVLHGAVRGGAWERPWCDWRERHAALDVAALVGNHDRALFEASARFGVRLLGAECEDGPFAFRHDPVPHATRHVVAGHVHPVVSLPLARRRWPAFWLQRDVTVLPAFSAFTGGWPVQLDSDTQAVVCGDGALVRLPPRVARHDAEPL